MRLRRNDSFLYLASALITLVVTARALALWRADWTVPFFYGSDAISNVMQIKTTLATGWYEEQPLLNAPAGMNLYDFATADNLGLVFARIAGLFTSSPSLILNVYYVLGFVLAAIAAVWFFRTVGISRIFTLVLSVLYAIAPYHFARNESHLWLAGYFVVPLAGVLIYRALTSGAPFTPPKGERTWKRWLFSPLVVSLGVVALVGTASTYYSVFTLFLLAFAGVVRWISDRNWRRLFATAGTAIALLVVVVANMLPDMLYAWSHGANAGAIIRTAAGTEVYSLKLAALILPIPGHRIGMLANIRGYYDRFFPLTGENPALGFIAAFGFVALFAIALYNLISRRSAIMEETFETGSRLRSLSALTVFAFSLATVGGFASILGLVTNSLRGWNRMSIVLALFALAAVGILLDALIRVIVRRVRPLRRLGYAVAAVVALGVLGFGYLDQVGATATPDYATASQLYAQDAALVSSIEDAVGDDASIVQLPYREFPESASDEGVPDSDQLKFFLHSDTLSWSAGGIKGRPESEWLKYAETLPTDEFADAMAAAGFEGVLIDTVAYGETAEQKVDSLTKLLGAPEASGSDRRYLFFSLADTAKTLDERYSTAVADEIGEDIVTPVYVRLEPNIPTQTTGLDLLKPFDPKIQVDNPRAEKVDVEISFEFTYAYGAAVLRFDYEDGTTADVRVASGENTITLPISAVPGRSFVDISLVSGAPWPKTEDVVITAIEMSALDVKLEDLLKR